MTTQNSIWLAASYHFPTTYSCRIPTSSQSSALAMPAPGPATIRLALVRTGIELFGIDYVREEFFPMICNAEIRVRPPDKVAISNQLLRAYKAASSKTKSSASRMVESITYRECHAEGVMTIYVKVTRDNQNVFKIVLKSIGYWGQSNSFTSCMEIRDQSPKSGECAIPLRHLNTSQSIQNFFSCIVSDFRDLQVSWEETQPILTPNKTPALRHELFVWPMIIERHGSGKLLRYRSLNYTEISLKPALFVISSEARNLHAISTIV